MRIRVKIDAKKALKNIRKETKNVGRETGRAAENVGRATDTAVRDVVREGGRALGNVAGVTEKAHRDAAVATVKGFVDVVDAVKVAARFQAQYVNSLGDTINDSAKRIAEGKLLDALWVAAMEPIQSLEENIIKAMQGSHVLLTIGQVAASGYGPGGTAAFAAWYAYRMTGNVEQAIRIGVISGATAAGLAATGSLKWESSYKAILAGSVGGMAVAASGGDEKAVSEAFLKGGCMMFLQEFYRSTAGADFDGRPPTEGPVILEDVLEEQKFPNGQVNRVHFTRHNHIGFEIRKEDLPSTSFWKLQLSDRGTPSAIAGMVPGVNGVAFFHDQWVTTWELNPLENALTIAPAIAITYLGHESTVLNEVQNAAMVVESSSEIASAPQLSPKPVIHPEPKKPKRKKPKPVIPNPSNTGLMF